MIKNYRKKPVEIQAVLLSEDNAADVAAWCGGEIKSMKNLQNPWKKRGPVGVDINTLEGTMLAEFGDYVIRGIQGEFYPCKPDIFLASYDEINAPAAADQPEEDRLEYMNREALNNVAERRGIPNARNVARKLDLVEMIRESRRAEASGKAVEKS